jgi:hypothetical protein
MPAFSAWLALNAAGCRTAWWKMLSAGHWPQQQNRRRHLPAPSSVAPLRELNAVSCLSVDGLNLCELGFVPQNRVHEDCEATSPGDPWKNPDNLECGADLFAAAAEPMNRPPALLWQWQMSANTGHSRTAW